MENLDNYLPCGYTAGRQNILRQGGDYGRLDLQTVSKVLDW